MTLTIRVRSAVWFATGAALALLIGLLVMDSWHADAAPGDTDTTLVSITPCRLADTRPPPERVGPNATVGIAATLTIQATGTNGQCTIPADAVGLSMNVTALSATVDSFLTFWPTGAKPLSANLNPSPGQPPVPNAVTVGLSPTGSFMMFNNLGTVDVVIDISGYYTKSSLKEIDTRLTSLDSMKPGLVFADGAQFLALTNAAQTVRNVTLAAPTAGYVSVTASGYTDFGSAGLDSARCTITDGSTGFADDAHDVYVDDFGIVTGSQFVPFSATRAFAVPAGNTTFRLLCREVAGTVTFSDSSMVAMFVPNLYTP